MASPTYFPTGYFGGAVSDGIVVSSGGKRHTFVELYATLMDYELGTNDSAVLFTTARRKQCVNEGLREFADLTECWTRETTIVCSNAVGTYNLHSSVNIPGEDFVRMTADGPTFRLTDASSNVTYTAGEDLPRRDEVWLNSEEPSWQTSTGATTPSAWYLSPKDGGLSLGLYPPPTISTGSSAVVVLPYVAKPSSLVDDTSVPFTGSDGITRIDLQPYHQAIVHYAAHKLELLRKDREASDRQMQKFLGYVQRFVQQKRDPSGKTIRPLRNYFTKARTRRHGDDLSGLRAPWWR